MRRISSLGYRINGKIIPALSCGWSRNQWPRPIWPRVSSQPYARITGLIVINIYQYVFIAHLSSPRSPKQRFELKKVFSFDGSYLAPNKKIYHSSSNFLDVCQWDLLMKSGRIIAVVVSPDAILKSIRRTPIINISMQAKSEAFGQRFLWYVDMPVFSMSIGR